MTQQSIKRKDVKAYLKEWQDQEFEWRLQRNLRERLEYHREREAEEKWVMRLILAVLTIAGVCVAIDLIVVATAGLAQ